MVFSKRIQKEIDCDSVTWYSTTQEADIRAWLIEEDMWGCRTAQAPRPDAYAIFVHISPFQYMSVSILNLHDVQGCRLVVFSSFQRPAIGATGRKHSMAQRGPG